MTYRERDIVQLDISTAFGDTLNVSVHVGMLPEDMLTILMRQQILRLRAGVVEWTGPDEKIQELMVGGYSSPKRSSTV